VEPRDEIYAPAAYDSFYSTYHFAPVARSGDHIYVSGVIGLKNDLQGVVEDPEGQYRAAFDMLETLLAESDTSINEIVDMSTFHTPESDQLLFARIKDEYIQGPAYPAWTSVTVYQLGFNALVEIKVVAVRGWSPKVSRSLSET